MQIKQYLAFTVFLLFLISGNHLFAQKSPSKTAYFNTEDASVFKDQNACINYVFSISDFVDLNDQEQFRHAFENSKIVTSFSMQNNGTVGSFIINNTTATDIKAGKQKEILYNAGVEIVIVNGISYSINSFKVLDILN